MEMQGEMSRDLAIEDQLAYYEAYIQQLVKADTSRAILSQIASPEEMDLEMDEVIQRVRISLWRIFQQKRSMQFPRAYIRQVVHNAILARCRQQRHMAQLSMDEDGELQQGQVILTQNPLVEDPAYQLEQQDKFEYQAVQVAQAVASLPLQQRQALVTVLKEQLDAFPGLYQAFAEQGIDLHSPSQLPNKKDYSRQRASLSIARKKLKGMLGELWGA